MFPRLPMYVFIDIRWSGILYVVALFFVTFTISIAAVGLLLVHLPAAYFLDSHVRDLWIDQHPVVRALVRILKNAVGLGVILLGVVLSLPAVPGQGLLTILIGLMLLDFPGKRALERMIVGRPGVHGRINRVRARFGKPPLLLSESARGEDRTEPADKQDTNT